MHIAQRLWPHYTATSFCLSVVTIVVVACVVVNVELACMLLARHRHIVGQTRRSVAPNPLNAFKLHSNKTVTITSLYAIWQLIRCARARLMHLRFN